MVSVALRQSAFSQLSNLTRSAPAIFGRGFASGHSKVVELLSDQDYQTALKELSASKESAVIDFTAKWCGPCKMMAPIYDKLSTDHPDIKFYKIDIDNAAMAYAVREHAIAAVPTFVGYKAGERLSAFSGADRTELQSMVQELKGGGS